MSLLWGSQKWTIWAAHQNDPPYPHFGTNLASPALLPWVPAPSSPHSPFVPDPDPDPDLSGLLGLHSKVVLTIRPMPTLVSLSLYPTTSTAPIHPLPSKPLYTRCFWPHTNAPYTPCPKPLPSAIHLSQTSPPTLAHWWFSTRRTQLPRSYRLWQSSISTHQPFNLGASSSPSNKLSPVSYTREPLAC